MRKNKKIPTILGILVLILGLAAGVVAVKSKLFLKSGATAEAAPKNVQATDIAAVSFSVSWVTDIESTGFVKYGEKENSLSQTQTEESAQAGYTHLVRIGNLKPQTKYFFKVNSGGSEFDNNKIPWQTQTAAENLTAPKTTLTSGSILTAAGTPARDALVYVSFGNNTFSAKTSTNGSWLIPVTVNLGGSTVLEILVQAGPEGIASAQIYPTSANPVPAIILGQTYDFKNLPPNQKSDNPEAQIGVPEEAAPVSGFEVPENPATPSAQTVTLDNIKEKETINTTQPELLGNAPPETVLTITVESELMTGNVSTPASGRWNWEVPNDLTPGDHKITITWKDTTGIARTLVRNFVVSAAEGPAFEATPSGTLRPSPSATPTHTATPSTTLRASPTATASAVPQPDSGSLTPTLLLSIMGIGLIAFSFLMWKHAETQL